MLRDRWLFGRKAKAFTLQWHLTNACRFHCKHCYDRTARGAPSWAEALAVLSDFQGFCSKRDVECRISLTGGDPLLYEHFWELYQAIAEARIGVSILGNPIPADVIIRLLRIQKPLYYQVSLEGLREHNDAVRGEGHYDQTIAFLRTARALDLRTHVMLTLTRQNMDQIIPLGDNLRGLTCRFTFNRLSKTGNAADLELPSQREFIAFLNRYLLARLENPVLGVKDNLLSILQRQRGRKPFPGCTGFGCGAAFDFVALLPDGEVHACRKLPSLLGTIRQSTFEEIYNSPAARAYRNGPEGCQRCNLRNVCGGCYAVSQGEGLDPIQDRDPYCFIASRE